MRLNGIGPAAGSKKAKRRVGRGPAPAGARRPLGARKARKPDPVAVCVPGFEGGQQPLQAAGAEVRLPLQNRSDHREIRLH